MSAAPDASLSAQVEAVLDRRARSHDKPSDADLRPVFDFLRPTFPASLNAPSSSHSPARPPNTHWFCSKTPKPRVREAATFLIFLFAFHQAGTSKEWVDALESVLEGCERCARAFGAARRRFSTK
jgi:senataxin